MTERSEKSHRRGKALALGAAGVFAALIAIWVAGARPDSGRSSWPAAFKSNGERLYFTGTSTSGAVLDASGGNRHMLMMGGGGCVACHGADRLGGRLFPNPWSVAPSITAAALTGTHGDETDGHAGHAPYTEETLARVITTGQRPDGSTVATAMPRWEIAENDLVDLVSYLMGSE